jgi:hypothetical protein
MFLLSPTATHTEEGKTVQLTQEADNVRFALDKEQKVGAPVPQIFH